MAGSFRHIGMQPFVSARTAYDTTGAAVSFRAPGQQVPRWSAHITVYVYSGTALVELAGRTNGTFIELAEGQSFDFPVETEALYIKAQTGSCDVGVVAALNPIPTKVG